MKSGVQSNLPMTVYPNPAIDFVTIQSGFSPNQSVIIEIIDGMGRTVRKVNFNQANGSLSLEGLSQGLYDLRMISGVEVHMLRIIKANN